MEVKPGYKQTEVGVIPEEWEVKHLGDVFALKHGFAFSSEYFSKVGPIVLTPGNFSLEGGLYFEDRNTKRFSGNYSPGMTLKRGDLLIVMTDLTPDCNLLGKPAFVESDELILHNQRIGRVVFKDENVEPRLLFFLLLSRQYLRRIKEQATGSTVRHTSNKNIFCIQLAIPPKPEQRAIATALSDVDGLLGGLDRLIAKKRDLKQAAMQQLLTGQTRLPGFHGEWEVTRLGEIAHIKTGSRNNEDKVEDGQYPFFVRSEVVERINSYSHDCEAILVPGEGRIGDIFHYINGRFDVHQRVYAITKFSPDISGRFIHFYLSKNFGAWAMQNTVKATVDSLRLPTFQTFEMCLPPTKSEQTAIAEVLTEMDAELAALEQRREKTRALKQAMMQELLTGRTRLVEPASLCAAAARGGQLGADSKG